MWETDRTRHSDRERERAREPDRESERPREIGDKFRQLGQSCYSVYVDRMLLGASVCISRPWKEPCVRAL